MCAHLIVWLFSSPVVTSSTFQKQSKTTQSKSMTANLRIFVSALLLHFDILIELAVWGAKIVISLHFSINLQSVSAACVRWDRSSVRMNHRLWYEPTSFPTVSFQRRSSQEEAWLSAWRANQRTFWDWLACQLSTSQFSPALVFEYA